MLGGGTFVTQNKVLPGSYINFISQASASATMSDRGIAAIPLVADWGPEHEVIRVEKEDFEKNSLAIFGYSYTHEQVQAVREIFRNARRLYWYRLNTGTQKASNDYADARYGGTRGNSLRIVIQKNEDNEELFDVVTWLDTSQIDSQTVANASELQDTDFVIWKKEAELQETAGMPLTGGSDGTGRTGEAYQGFLDKISAYSFHALGCNTDEKEVIDLFVSFTKRMRDEVGMKFQTVVYRAENADYEGVISVENALKNVNPQVFGEFSLVYWVTGAAAGCAVNKSNTNKVYDGEYTIDVEYSQTALEEAIRAGKFVFHQVGEEIRVLTDMNTLVTVTDEKGEDFKSNQTIRVLDQIGNDIAELFNTRYLGRVANDNAGRLSLWGDIVEYFRQLEQIRAIEGFDPESVTCEMGQTRKSVIVTVSIRPTNCMEQLYMTVLIN